MKKLKFLPLVMVLAALGAVVLWDTDNNLTPTAEAAEMSGDFDQACYCELDLNGCYVPAGIPVYCPNGVQAEPIVLSDGNWCYPDTRSGSCQVPCMTQCL